MDEEIDLRDGAPREIDLRDRLRFAADSLVADFGEDLSAERAEALVFSSAEGLLATASVTEFVPILAERRARLAVRFGAPAPTAVPLSPPASVAPATAPPAPAPAAPAPVAPAPVPPAERASPGREAPGSGSAVAALFAVPVDEMDRLRDRVDRVRVRVSDWRAEQDRR